MKKLCVLVIDHDPLREVIRSAAGLAGIDLEIHLSKTYTDAVDWLCLSEQIDAVFICYNFRNGDNTVDSHLVRSCIHYGFGGSDGKPLVAFSRDAENDKKLLAAGCNLLCERKHLVEFFKAEFGEVVKK